MIWRIRKMQKKKTFKVSFYCKNCNGEMTFEFPVGTNIIRAPYLGYDDAETRVIIPRIGEANEHQVLKCKHCEIGNIA